MKRFIPIDLREHYNHRLIYTEVSGREEELGAEGIYILKSDLKIPEEAVLDGVEFRFAFGRFDNVLCERQRVAVDGRASAIHFIGFGHWGDTNEYFRIIYDDSDEELARVPFIDWVRKPYSDFNSTSWFGNNTTTAAYAISSGVEGPYLIHFHHMVAELTGRKRIKEILFPDNMFTHIFAMTLEDDDHR